MPEKLVVFKKSSYSNQITFWHLYGLLGQNLYPFRVLKNNLPQELVVGEHCCKFSGTHRNQSPIKMPPSDLVLGVLETKKLLVNTKIPLLMVGHPHRHTPKFIMCCYGGVVNFNVSKYMALDCPNFTRTYCC